MRQFFSNKKLIILLVSVIVCVGLVGYSLRPKSSTPWFQQVGKDSASLVDRVLAVPANLFANLFGTADDLKNTYTENEILKNRVEEFAENQTKLQELEEENAKLKEELDLNASLSDYQMVSASVIARNPDAWIEKIIVDKGTTSGVQKDMAVMSEKGLIGKVVEVSATSSTVQLLSTVSTSNRISAVTNGDDGSAVYGVINGYDKDNKFLVMNQLTAGKNAKVGEEVRTSGLGGVFPRGLLVGTVEEVKLDSFGLAKEVYVTPAADINDIRFVTIIIRTLESGE